MNHSSRPPASFVRLAFVGFVAYVFFSGLVSVLGSAAVLLPLLAVPFVLVAAKLTLLVVLFRGFGRLAGSPAVGCHGGRPVAVERDHAQGGRWRRSAPGSRHDRSGRPAPVDPDWERAKREAREELDREFPDPQAP